MARPEKGVKRSPKSVGLNKAVDRFQKGSTVVSRLPQVMSEYPKDRGTPDVPKKRAEVKDSPY